MDFSVFHLGALYCSDWLIQGIPRWRRKDPGKRGWKLLDSVRSLEAVMAGVKTKVQGQGRVGVCLMRCPDQSLRSQWSRSRTGVWGFGWTNGAWSFWEAGTPSAYPLPKVTADGSLWRACTSTGACGGHVDKTEVVLATRLSAKGLLLPLLLWCSLFGRKSLASWLRICHLIIFNVSYCVSSSY